MPREEWPLRHGRPCVQVVLTLALDGKPLLRTLLADTGAGSQHSAFELILDEDDCLLSGGNPDQPISLGGAYVGSFPSYVVLVQLPALGFAQNLRVDCVPTPPAGFDSIACFGFLNRFQYGNFGNLASFGLES
ncbi:MAG: hypothetical protein L0Y72_29345 [Gemmataceae bacterium]|nr:hypothetical protein [Gemmataceae bacterium]